MLVVTWVAAPATVARSSPILAIPLPAHPMLAHRPPDRSPTVLVGASYESPANMIALYGCAAHSGSSSMYVPVHSLRLLPWGQSCLCTVSSYARIVGQVGPVSPSLDRCQSGSDSNASSVTS